MIRNVKGHHLILMAGMINDIQVETCTSYRQIKELLWLRNTWRSPNTANITMNPGSLKMNSSFLCNNFRIN